MAGWKRFRHRIKLWITLFALVVLAGVGFLNDMGTVAGVGTTSAVVGVAHTKNATGQWVEYPTDSQIDAAVREAVSLAGGLPANVAPGKKVVIQPNLVEAGWPSGSGVVPNAQVVRTVIKMCIERGASASDITICEGTAAFRYGTTHTGYTDRQMTVKELKDAGLDTDGDMWVEDTNGTHIARCVDANNVGRVYSNYPGYSGPYDSAYVTQVTKPGFLIDRVYMLPNCVMQADVLIRIPVLKNHGLAGITGALKLAFGFAPTDIYHLSGYNYYKNNLLHQEAWGYSELDTNARGMADMTYCRPPDFIVCDALVGITNGPVGSNGSVTAISPRMAFIMASRDPVAIDTVQTLACGYGVWSIPALSQATGLGLGTCDPGQIEIRGPHLKDIRRWFPTSGCAGVGDGVAPSLPNLNISDGIHVCGSLSVGHVGASDSNPGLCKAELYVDDALVDSNHIPYFNTIWTPGSGAAGQHTVKYTIYDRMLNEASLTRTVYVEPGDAVVSALGMQDGTAVCVGPLVFAGAAPGIDNRTFFLVTTDGIRGIRVRYGTNVPAFTLGRRLSVIGSLATSGGMRYVNCTGYTVHEQATAPKPRFMRNSALGGAAMNGYAMGVLDGRGPYNLGCLVKTSGVVSTGGSDYFYIDDGSLNNDTSVPSKLKVKCGTLSQPSPGSYVSVVGFSCCEDVSGGLHRTIVPRSSSDITVLKSP